MKLKGQLQWTDYLNSQLLHMQRSKLERIIINVLLLVFVFVTIGGLLFVAIGQSELQISSFIPMILIVAIFPLYRYVMLPRRVKQIFIQQKELSSPFEIEITDVGMNFSNEYGNSTRPWRNFTKWKENKELLVLYHSDVMFSIIPKRIFSDSQQLDTIKNLLEKNKVSVTKNRSIISYVIYFVLLIIIGSIMYINFRNTLSQ